MVEQQLQEYDRLIEQHQYFQCELSLEQCLEDSFETGAIDSRHQKMDLKLSEFPYFSFLSKEQSLHLDLRINKAVISTVLDSKISETVTPQLENDLAFQELRRLYAFLAITRENIRLQNQNWEHISDFKPIDNDIEFRRQFEAVMDSNDQFLDPLF